MKTPIIQRKKEYAKASEVTVIMNDDDNKVEVSVLHREVLDDLHIQTPRREIPRLSLKDIKIESLLGSGTFSDVFNVSFFNTYSGDEQCARESSSDSKGPHESEHEHSSRSLTSAPKYALKVLKEDMLDDHETATLALKDAYFEGELLSHLPVHANVIKLAMVSDNVYKDPTKGFLILEKVSETLKHRMARWSRLSKNCKQTRCFQFAKQRREIEYHQRNRIEYCALGIANGLKFLHEHRIVYRDLKPANVGFGYDGQVKLFDFGLARTLTPDHPTRRLTGGKGTARYMAPEVARHENYCLSADIHSFGIVLWEICTLEVPYKKHVTVDKLQIWAVHNRRRPSLGKIASSRTRALLEACWDPLPRLRPSAALVLEALQDISTENFKGGRG